MSREIMLPCLFGDCQVTFPVGDSPHCCDTQPLERHLMQAHCLVIDSIVDIADLHRYISHWRELISQETVKVHCFVFHPGPGAVATVELGNNSTEYMFLSYENPDDAKLREQLHLKRLAEVTDVYQRERGSLENLPCIFCNDVSLNRQMIFEHLSTEHSFQLGDPDNMVFVPELLHHLAEMINSHICLYCEKQFRDRFVLKEHMRKRNHRRVKPANSAKYAKYYLSNYLEQGGLRLAAQQQQIAIGAVASMVTTVAVDAAAESDDEIDDKSVDDEDSVPRNRRLDLEDSDKELLPATAASPAELQTPVCQLCHQEDQLYDPLKHLIDRHSIDLHDVSRRHSLDFYQRLRLLAKISDPTAAAGESIDTLAVEAKLHRVTDGVRPATQWEVTLADLCDDI